MDAAQPGIFAQGARHHYHLEFDLRPDATPEDVGAALAGLREPAVTAGGANVVVAFGPDGAAYGLPAPGSGFAVPGCDAVGWGAQAGTLMPGHWVGASG